MEIPECFYRVSIKALILNEKRDKFLICEEEDGGFDLPGGGLDWGTSPQEDLSREIMEEMGLKVTRVAKNPSYFYQDKSRKKHIPIANVIYEAELENLDFKPSNECISIRFVNKEDISGLDVFPVIRSLTTDFDPKRHLKRLI